jgi:hypothetical protein
MWGLYDSQNPEFLFDADAVPFIVDRDLDRLVMDIHTGVPEAALGAPTFIPTEVLR